MTTRMTRKGFCGALLGGSVLLLIQSCGGGGTDYSGTPATPSPSPSPPTPTPSSNPGPSPSSGSASVGCSNTIAANHGHVLAVALADLDSASDKTYDIQGSADHSHTVTLTVAQLRSLKTGSSVTTASSIAFDHQHQIVITCL